MSDRPRPPNGAPDSQVWPASPGVLRRATGCARYTPDAPLLRDIQHSHSPCRHTNVAALRPSAPAALSRPHRVSRPTASCRDDWPPLPRRPAESPARRLAHGVWSLACHGPWDWRPWLPPQRGFGDRSIDTLPGPFQTLQVIIDGQGLHPQPGKDASLDPLGKVVVDRAGRAKSLPWTGLPLDPGPQDVEDPLGNAPEVGGARVSGFAFFRWDKRFQTLPQCLRQLPGRTLWVTVGLHGRPPRQIP